MKKFILGYQLLLVSFMGWFVWMLDDWQAFSLTYPSYIYVCAGGLLALLIPTLANRSAGTFLTPLAWCVFTGLLPFIDTNGLKPLMRAANSLTVEMDREQIFAAIRGEYEGTGFQEPVVLDESAEQILLQPRPRSRNAESLRIRLSASRFRAAEFSAD